MKSGDHIYVDRGLYTHHGIYINKKQVIHFNGTPFQNNKDSVICYTTPAEFAKGGAVRVQFYKKRLSHRSTVLWAKKLLGQGEYDLLWHNCEHFATWCATGESESKQVALYVRAGVVGAATLGVLFGSTPVPCIYRARDGNARAVARLRVRGAGARLNTAAGVIALILSGGFAPAQAVDTARTASTATAGSLAQQYVTRVYGDLFSRVRDPVGLQAWSSALLTGTPRVAVANAITGSAEFRGALITDAYRHSRVTPTPTTWSGGYGLFEDTQYLTGTALSARLDEYKAVGVQWARFQLLWSTIQSGGPTSYDWKPVDDLVAGLLARGIRPIAVIGTTPLWASRPAGCAAVTCAPADPAQFAAFAARASARYAPRGVHTWEVWNEPNSATFWKPAPDVASYTVVLKQTYAAIKAADPLATVITGGVAPAVTTSWSIAPLEFLAGIYFNGGQGSFDGFGWHPYTYPRMPGTVDNGDAWYQMYGPANSARAQMTAHGDAAKKIWATEFGAHTDPLGGGYVTEAGQAEVFRTGLTLWTSYPWAGPMIGYMLRDRGTDTADRENFFGLTRYDGSPKPTFATFTSLVRDFAASHPTF